MQNLYSTKSSELNDEIDLKELFHVLLKGKWIIISVTTFISIIGVIYSLLLPNVYQSEALLAPVEGSGGISASLRNYSGIAGLAGINLPMSADKGNTTEAIEKIRSLSFFENNILPNIYLPDIMALDHWDPKENRLTYDKNIFNAESNTWVRDYSHPQQQIPSAQESFRVFREHLNLNEDKQTGFIFISIKHQSPHIAKQLIELVVDEINNFFRERDKLESQKSISYLNQQISMTSFSEIKESLAQLVQDETKRLTLVEAKQFYVFDYIDPPAVMEVKSEPKRVLIFIISAILGGMLSIVTVFIRHYFFTRQAK